MEINKKNRTEIKKFFRANAIPTQRNFEELIDANLNQAEDGIARPSGHPLSIQAEGDAKSVQALIHFYKKFDDENPTWSINQNPRLVAKNPDTNKPGLSINDGSGTSRLFIASTGGAVGIGTIEPAAKLHIADGDIILEDPAANSRAINWKNKNGWWHLSGPRSYEGANQLSFYWHDNTKWNGPYLTIKDLGDIGVGTLNPQAKFQVVNGAIMPAPGNGGNAGIQFPKNAFGGSGDSAWMRYYSRTGEAATLELGIGNDADDHIALMPTGSVGIGTLTPGWKLHVNGSLALEDPGESSRDINLFNKKGRWHLSGPRSYEGANQFGIYWHDNTVWKGPFFSIKDDGNVGIGTNQPVAKLQVVGGAIMPTAGNTEQSGILFPPDAFGGGGDRAWMRWYSRGGEATTLELGVGNDGDDHIALMPTGNVGIGTNSPNAKLDVNGTVRTPYLHVYLNNGSPSSGMASFESENTEPPYVNWYHKKKRYGYIQAGDFGGINMVRLTADQADRFHFHGGSVGINTTTPSQQLDVAGNVNINGALFMNGRPVVSENFEIFVRGSAFGSPQGNYTLMKVAGQSIPMNASRGLNTTILKTTGEYKTQATHDVYGSAGNWNVWADWVTANSATDEVVCVSTYDAISNCPRGGSAENLLLTHGASKAFSAVTNAAQVPYTLVFARRQDGCIEDAQPYKGRNSYVRVCYYDLFQFNSQVICGMIVMWSGSKIPAGWSLCDGSNGTPDLRGRFILGAGNGGGLTNRILNQYGGEEKHTLSVAEMPAHAHGMSNNGNHTHRHDFWQANDLNWSTHYGGPFPIGTDDRFGGWSRDLTYSGDHSHTVANTGGNAAHNNMPPYFVLAYIMKL